MGFRVFVVNWQEQHFDFLEAVLARCLKMMQLSLDNLLSFEEVVAMSDESWNNLQSILILK